MAYDTVFPSILNVIDLLNSTPAEGAAVLRQSFHMPERRFLARTAQQWGWDDGDTLRVLSALLRDTSADVRAEAYYSLIRCAELHGARLLSELEEQLEQEPWVQIARAHLLRRLAATDVPRVLKLLCPLAASGITWVEKEVAPGLLTCWFLDRDSTWQAMEDWLHYDSANVREVAVRFVSRGFRPDGSTAPAILLCTADDRASQVRAACARGISIWAWEDLDLAIPTLRRLASDRTHWHVRAAVTRGLTHWRKVAPYEALDVLMPLLRDGVSLVRRLAFRQLGALRHECTNLTIEASVERPCLDDMVQDILRGRSRMSRRATDRRRGGQRVFR